MERGPVLAGWMDIGQGKTLQGDLNRDKTNLGRACEKVPAEKPYNNNNYVSI